MAVNNNMKKFRQYCEELMAFFREKGIDLGEEDPVIDLDASQTSRFDPFAPTGHYDYTTNTVTLRISNRQCKDILRTLAHELIHVSQYVKDPDGYAKFDKSGKVADNAVLRKYEAQAYRDGNLLFRDWTENQDG